MRYDVIVVGAGIVGTSIAWHLQKNNAQVLLLDKKPQEKKPPMVMRALSLEKRSIPNLFREVLKRFLVYCPITVPIFATAGQRYMVFSALYFSTGSTLVQKMLKSSIRNGRRLLSIVLMSTSR